MQSRMIHQENGLRTFILSIDQSEEMTAALREFAQRNHVYSGGFSGSGHLEDVTLGQPDWSYEEYMQIPGFERPAFYGLSGQVSDLGGRINVRTRVMPGGPEHAYGGYLLKGYVQKPFDLVFVELPRFLPANKNASPGSRISAYI